MDKTTVATPWINILIVTGGMTPQVVTETVWALAQRKPDPFHPHKIICVVTAKVAARFRQELVEALDRLAKDWDVPTTWAIPVVAIPAFPDGRQLDDVRTNEETTAFGDFVNELVRRETDNPAARIHLSLAGGRKTMSYHGGAALGLWGRAQDELSHALVGVRPEALARDPSLRPEEFEHSREFWYPTRQDNHIEGPAGRAVTTSPRTINARDADIDLTEVPFVPLRDLLPPTIQAATMSYADWVDRFKHALSRRLILRLIPPERRVIIGDIADFQLPHVDFALYQLMAEWAQKKIPGAGPNGVGPEHFGWLTNEMLGRPQNPAQINPIERYLAIYEQVCVTWSDKAEGMKHNLSTAPKGSDREEQNKAFFRKPLKQLRTKIEEAVSNPNIADRFAPPRGNKIRPPRFGLKLSPDEIIIES